jgi:hypothetical protein
MKGGVVRSLRSRRHWGVLGLTVLAAAIGAGIALATVTPTQLADTNTVRLKIVRNEFVPSADQPVFDSGWHTHPGPVIVQVQTGRLRLRDATCLEATIVGPGETYLETPQVPVRARASNAVTWTTSFILPDSHPGDPDRTAVSNPCA